MKVLIASSATFLFKMRITTVLPAKSDSDVMFVYKVIMDLESIDHVCVSILPAGYDQYTSDLSICVGSSGVYKFMFYLTIVNIILRHCHSWLAP